MRFGEKHWQSAVNHDIFRVDFHRFLELEGDLSHMEIAEELGISLGEVNQLRKKVNRT
ncbi:MAG TPA: hypothetical protein VK136_03430 [Bacillota bacterium]|nr:hypothetical protein [Bacillota bacterium]